MGACKEALSVTFHKNMSAQDITETWIFKVPAIIKALNPTLDNAMNIAYAAILAAIVLKQTKEAAEDAFKAVQATQEVVAASAPPTTNPSHATTKASTIAADQAAKAADAAVEAGKQALLTSLDTFCAAQLAP